MDYKMADWGSRHFQDGGWKRKREATKMNLFFANHQRLNQEI